jgi:hypothetical protein
MKPQLLRSVLIVFAFAFALVWNGEVVPRSVAGFMSTADAVIGRPATPVSYAGVARRTTRRAVAADAATQTCATAYDQYGQPVQVCE